jgi:hypothetical protein
MKMESLCSYLDLELFVFSNPLNHSTLTKYTNPVTLHDHHEQELRSTFKVYALLLNKNYSQPVRKSDLQLPSKVEFILRTWLKNPYALTSLLSGY